MKPYTVKVPVQWAGMDSARAQTYLREFFIHPLTLPADPGAGERVLRLTLSERQVDALSRGSGDVPAVALRRLLAARIRELPAASIPAAESRAVVPAPEKPPKPRSRSWAGESLPIPEWFDFSNPNRASYWKSFGADYQRQVIQAHRAWYGGGKVNTQKQVAQELSGFERAVLWVADHWTVLVVVGVLLILVGRKAGWFATAAAGTASAAPAFSLWRPE